ncbi:MAG: Spo0E like sporulation regulatory protein [Anaerocolumna sp.]|jgi:hypothetical protein|nr:Spo0E like sporulation regulatory protein [Anaerocolumna sp.]
MQKITADFESRNNMLQKIDQMKRELNNTISFYNGNINHEEVAKISRILDVLIVEYHEDKFYNRS